MEGQSSEANKIVKGLVLNTSPYDDWYERHLTLRLLNSFLYVAFNIACWHLVNRKNFLLNICCFTDGSST